MRILIACEQWGRVRTAFRNKDHDAWSCDIDNARDDSPYHIRDDVMNHLNGWDMIIGFPPCTYLSNRSNAVFYDRTEFDKKRAAAIEFVKIIYNSCGKVCIENPSGALSTQWMKPTQVINPYQFGEPWKKRTCIWLKGLPELQSTNWVGSVQPTWHPKSYNHRESGLLRSRTFQGIADAMADQWG